MWSVLGLLVGARACRLTSSWSGPSYGVACAPHVRHFIVHTRRAGHVVTRPLNCGVRQHPNRMRTRPLQHVSGGWLGFEVSNTWLQPRAAARLLQANGAEITYRRKLFRGGDVHIRFRYAGLEFQLVEPYGDSSCYEIVPVDAEHPPQAELAEIRGFFDRYRPGVFGTVASLFGG